MKLNVHPFNLVAMIDDLLLPFIAFVKDRHITLQTYYHLQGLSVNADPQYLHRVLTNLLANAVKFTPTVVPFVCMQPVWWIKEERYNCIWPYRIQDVVSRKRFTTDFRQFLSVTEYRGLPCIRTERNRYRLERL